MDKKDLQEIYRLLSEYQLVLTQWEKYQDNSKKEKIEKLKEKINDIL